MFKESSELLSKMTFDYPRSSLKSPRNKFPTMTQKHRTHVEKVQNMSETIEKPSVCFSRLPPALFPPEKAQKKRSKYDNEEDARRKIMAIRPINSSSTSVSNPNVKKHMIGKIYGYRWTIQCGGLGRRKRKPREWVGGWGGREVGGWG